MMTNPIDSLPTFSAASDAYRAAWENPAHTRFELPPVNVNKVLRERYSLRPEKALTRTAIWDMERQKAWDPRTYIPYVVSEGGSWGPRDAAGRRAVLARIAAEGLDRARRRPRARRRLSQRRKAQHRLSRALADAWAGRR
jgi:hypothetical protein